MLFRSAPFTNADGVFYIPTDYAYTAIAYNSDTVPAEDVASVQVFADPKYAGRISLPDNTDDVWSLAFIATGTTSWDNVTDEQFTAAADWLRAVHPNVRAYWADPSELAQLMASGEVQVAWSWNDPVAILQSEGFPVGFNRAPAEGAATWYCGFVNMKDGPGNVAIEDSNGNSVKLEVAGITITAAMKVTVNAAQVAVSAGLVQVDAGMSKFSGVVQCDTLIATTVIAATYTPGAGNIW